MTIEPTERDELANGQTRSASTPPAAPGFLVAVTLVAGCLGAVLAVHFAVRVWSCL